MRPRFPNVVHRPLTLLTSERRSSVAMSTANCVRMRIEEKLEAIGIRDLIVATFVKQSYGNGRFVDYGSSKREKHIHTETGSC